jgi:hypothetical protein
VLRLDVLLPWPVVLWRQVLSLRLYLLRQWAGLRPRPDVLRLDVLLQWPAVLRRLVLTLRLYLLRQRAGLRPRPDLLRLDVLLRWPDVLSRDVLSPRLYVLWTSGLQRQPALLRGQILLRDDANLLLLRDVLQRRPTVLRQQVLQKATIWKHPMLDLLVRAARRSLSRLQKAEYGWTRRVT